MLKNTVATARTYAHDFFFFLLGALFMTWLLVCTFLNGNIVPLVSCLFIRPFSSRTHEEFLCSIADLGWNCVVDYCEYIGRFEPIFYGDLDLIRESYNGNKLLISNHVAMTDGVALFAVAQRIGRLGYLRFFAKNSLRYFPVLGLACYFLNFVFLSRNWLKDSSTIRKTFSNVVEWSRFWMCLFPEGTRISTRKLKSAQEFARERGLPPLQHVLQPRVKGLCAVLTALRGEVDGVVDVTIGYTDRDVSRGVAAPGLGGLLVRRPAARQRLHLAVRLLPSAGLPDGGDPAAVAAWARDCFGEKDRILEVLARTGSFPYPPCPRWPSAPLARPRPRSPVVAAVAAAAYTLLAAAAAALCVWGWWAAARGAVAWRGLS